MPINQNKKKLLIIIATVVIAAAGAIPIYRIYSTPPAYTGPIPMPVQTTTLKDSSVVWLQKDTRITPVDGFPQKRQLTVDGDAFLDVADEPTPLIINTRLLQLTVQGKASFRVIAFSKEDGEEVQVISGNILVDKNYESPFNEQDTLHNSQMVMINKTIDLMEKEKFDATDLTAWRAVQHKP
ncbi:FecR family protein [Filimonas lacunae]|uniref:FecR family protein n=1 Tax=Filimonas lacunae TaxID=477680 RepID=A0A173MLU6_9BACT|nr:FecR domain-containing protein [Filimonas lacunae]BAV08371.1 anti-FecI sigma factor, FecR [Filimonas lacunae]SIT33466.1 FecR family protein [Filimonas lacunae]